MISTSVRRSPGDIGSQSLHLDRAGYFKLDHCLDWCDVEFSNGCRIAVRFHLSTAHELGDLFRPHFAIEDLRGRDIFHNRFVPDQRWNPASVVVNRALVLQLARPEEAWPPIPLLWNALPTSCSWSVVDLGTLRNRRRAQVPIGSAL